VAIAAVTVREKKSEYNFFIGNLTPFYE